MKKTLVGLHYSPWTEKARWALDCKGINYTYREYAPMIGEVYLRWVHRKLFSKVSVPVLSTPHGPVRDSFKIALFAEDHGKGPSLFSQMDQINAWNARSENALAAGRSLLMNRFRENREAQAESIPKWIPGPLRTLSKPLAAVGVEFIVNKYVPKGVSMTSNENALREELLATRNALQGKDYLLGEFSYADIAMAVVLQMVKPVDDKHLRLGPATRQVWTDEKLAKEFEDLLAWRDRLYDKHRNKNK